MDQNYWRRMQENDDYWRKMQKDDDDFVINLFSMMNNHMATRTPIYTSSQTGARYVNEVLQGHELRCKREFRMEIHVFYLLVKCLKDKGLLRDTRYVTVEEQVAMFLHTLAKNASNRAIQERFQHSGETASRHFRQVLYAVTQLSRDFIRLPRPLTPPKIRNNSKFFPYFEDCIGAIDGTHIPITISTSLQEPYRNRKQTLSQNVMVACDFNLHFVYVRAGWEGSASDARILQDSLDNDFEVPQNKYYLVDAGYANTPNFIAPYRNTRYHIKEQGQSQEKPKDYKELFNLRHAQLRNHVERIIGILKMRFPILKVATFHPIESQTNIAIASCVLHNFIRIHNGETNWLNENSTGINQAHVVVMPDGDEEYAANIEHMNNQRQAGNRKRDDIAHNMWNDYIARRHVRNS